MTKVGDDGFGADVRGALAGFGVDPSYVATHPTYRTPLAFCELFPPDEFPLLFYREPQAPDMTLTSEELPLEAIRSAGVFWVTGTGLSAEPAAGRRWTPCASADGGGSPSSTSTGAPWHAPDEALSLYREALGVTVAVGNRDEVEVAVGEAEPQAAAEALLELGVELAVVKQGRTASSRRRGRAVEAPPVPSWSSTSSA